MDPREKELAAAQAYGRFMERRAQHLEGLLRQRPALTQTQSPQQQRHQDPSTPMHHNNAAHAAGPMAPLQGGATASAGTPQHQQQRADHWPSSPFSSVAHAPAVAAAAADTAFASPIRTPYQAQTQASAADQVPRAYPSMAYASPPSADAGAHPLAPAAAAAAAAFANFSHAGHSVASASAALTALGGAEGSGGGDDDFGGGARVVEELMRLREENALLRQHYKLRVADINTLKVERDEAAIREARLVTINEKLEGEMAELRDILPARLLQPTPMLLIQPSGGMGALLADGSSADGSGSAKGPLSFYESAAAANNRRGGNSTINSASNRQQLQQSSSSSSPNQQQRGGGGSVLATSPVLAGARRRLREILSEAAAVRSRYEAELAMITDQQALERLQEEASYASLAEEHSQKNSGGDKSRRPHFWESGGGSGAQVAHRRGRSSSRGASPSSSTPHGNRSASPSITGRPPTAASSGPPPTIKLGFRRVARMYGSAMSVVAFLQNETATQRGRLLAMMSDTNANAEAMRGVAAEAKDAGFAVSESKATGELVVSTPPTVVPSSNAGGLNNKKTTASSAALATKIAAAAVAIPTDPNWRYENILFFASADDGPARASLLLGLLKVSFDNIKAAARSIDDTVAQYNTIARHAVAAVIVLSQSCASRDECAIVRARAREALSAMAGARRLRREAVDVIVKGLLPPLAIQLRQAANAVVAGMTRRIANPKVARPLISQLELMALKCSAFDASAVVTPELLTIPVGAVERVLSEVILGGGSGGGEGVAAITAAALAKKNEGSGGNLMEDDEAPPRGGGAKVPSSAASAASQHRNASGGGANADTFSSAASFSSSTQFFERIEVSDIRALSDDVVLPPLLLPSNGGSGGGGGADIAAGFVAFADRCHAALSQARLVILGRDRDDEGSAAGGGSTTAAANNTKSTQYNFFATRKNEFTETERHYETLVRAFADARVTEAAEAAAIRNGAAAARATSAQRRALARRGSYPHQNASHHDAHNDEGETHDDEEGGSGYMHSPPTNDGGRNTYTPRRRGASLASSSSPSAAAARHRHQSPSSTSTTPRPAWASGAGGGGGAPAWSPVPSSISPPVVGGLRSNRRPIGTSVIEMERLEAKYAAVANANAAGRGGEGERGRRGNAAAASWPDDGDASLGHFAAASPNREEDEEADFDDDADTFEGASSYGVGGGQRRGTTPPHRSGHGRAAVVPPPRGGGGGGPSDDDRHADALADILGYGHGGRSR